MKKTISNVLKGKMGDTLIFLTYVAVDTNEKNAHKYAMIADVKYQNVISHINNPPTRLKRRFCVSIRQSGIWLIPSSQVPMSPIP